MKRIFLSLLAICFSFGLVALEADAKRFGGGKSSGMQRNVAPKQAPQRQADQPAQRQQQPAAAPTQKRSWLGPLAGLAAGIGLAALFSHLGMGEGMANFVMLLLLGLVAFVAIRWIMGRLRPAAAAPRPLQYAGGPSLDKPAPAFDRPSHSGPSLDKAPAPFKPQSPFTSTGAEPVAVAGFPADVDAEAFLRVAKLNFVRLQAAYDAGDLEDLRSFTSPEMFAEIKLQLGERGQAGNHTDVVTLEADLLDYSREPQRDLASVRFHGLIRETADGAADPFDETWHLLQPRDGRHGWVVAGITQNG
ncbi:Tim44 domain-containing protein [Chitinimonas koreensis]|uniref:Tim44 domain-containing protein n=1 Tax=Chitinimonas koreensis TaxID=356302 RepID=UPI0004204462|nr:Tim44-like domain-containing protein [Chitinimonas koreensis]QNM97572.1 Tim44 domain-containing protein [Chitinimonas koreensis]